MVFYIFNSLMQLFQSVKFNNHIYNLMENESKYFLNVLTARVTLVRYGAHPPGLIAFQSEFVLYQFQCFLFQILNG